METKTKLLFFPAKSKGISETKKDGVSNQTWSAWLCVYMSNDLLICLLRRGVLDTTLCDKVCQWLAAGQWFSLGTPVSSTNKTDRHDITEILLKEPLNTNLICLRWT